MKNKPLFAIIREAGQAFNRFHDRIARSEKARNWAGFAAVAVISAVVLTFAQNGQVARSGTLTAPVTIPIVIDGKLAGSTTLPEGATVDVHGVKGNKVEIAIGESTTWVGSEMVEVEDEEPIGLETPMRSYTTRYTNFPMNAFPALAGTVVSNPLLELAKEGEDAGEPQEESIIPGEGVSTWTLGGCNTGTTRSRIVFTCRTSGCQRAVVQCAQNGTRECSIPAPERPDPQDGFEFSTKNVSRQIKNARPNTFYIDPQNYRKLGLLANGSIIQVGASKPQPCAQFGAYAPGKAPKIPGQVNMTASWWDGGIRGWLVTKLPKDAEGVVNVKLNYIRNDGESIPNLRPAFYGRKGAEDTKDVGLLDKPRICGNNRDPYIGSFPIPEGATHFVIKPGFDGKDKGVVTIWNIEIKVNREVIPEPVDHNGLPDGDENPGGDPASEAEVIRLTNLERIAHGLAPLLEDGNLNAAARYHAEDMARENYYDHDSYDRVEDTLQYAGDTFSRIRRFDGRPSAENIAKGQQSPQEVVQAWMDSPGHRKNILAAETTRIGVGRAGDLWVQNFGF
jgi:hypothetical protein